jgi:hypothetical protein
MGLAIANYRVSVIIISAHAPLVAFNTPVDERCSAKEARRVPIPPQAEPKAHGPDRSWLWPTLSNPGPPTWSFQHERRAPRPGLLSRTHASAVAQATGLIGSTTSRSASLIPLKVGHGQPLGRPGLSQA